MAKKTEIDDFIIDDEDRIKGRKNFYGRSITPKVCDDKVLVNRSGYIPTKVRVEQYLHAGRLLKGVQESFKIDEFEDEDEAYDAPDDPTGDPDYDISDAHQDTLTHQAIVKKARYERRVKSEQGDVGGLEQTQSAGGIKEANSSENNSSDTPPVVGGGA